jgi:hypothetical protein
MKVQRRLVIGTAALAMAFTGTITNFGGTAVAAGTSNLSVSQTTSDGSTSNETLVTIKVLNSGTSAASPIILSGLVNSTSSGVGIVAKSSTPTSKCVIQPAPVGFNFMYSCTTASIAAGGTWTLVLAFTGTAGAAFKNFVTVGESSPGDSNLANNKSTLNSWFGARADLALTQVVLRTTQAGTATVKDTVVNNGGWTAHNLQLVIEVKAAGSLSVTASSNLPTSCQIIPPAAGYNLAASCTTNTLAPGASWIVTFAHHGPAGNSLQQVGTVSENGVADPVGSNNSATTNTSYHS